MYLSNNCATHKENFKVFTFIFMIIFLFIYKNTRLTNASQKTTARVEKLVLRRKTTKIKWTQKL